MRVGPWPPQAGEPEAAGPLVQRDAALLLQRLGDRPLVVLAEEHDRRVEHRGPHEGLIDVALAGGAVAEVGDDGFAATSPALPVLVIPADRPVALDAHRVPGGVQGLAADDDRVEVELVLLRVPAAVADAAVELEQLDRVDAAAPGHAVLAVGREHHVTRAQRPGRADLRGLLPEQRGPDAELALALQRDRLGVDPADQDQVPVHGPDIGGGQVERIVGMLDAFALRGEQLDELFGLAGLKGLAGGERLCGGGRTAGFDGHVPLLSEPGLGSPAPARWARVPGHICHGAVAYAACPVGRTRPRSSKTLLTRRYMP